MYPILHMDGLLKTAPWSWGLQSSRMSSCQWPDLWFFLFFACRIEKGKHDLILTNFETATYCNFCGKKVRYTCICMLEGFWINPHEHPFQNVFNLLGKFLFFFSQIWLKQAYLCSLCKTKCHKKCAEKYQMETLCTE